MPGAAERVIYAGTFSKPFATGVRVGYGILPGLLFTAVKHIKGNHDFGTSNLLQHLVARALVSGIYGRHVARLQKRYAHKARVMKQAIKKHFPPAVEWWEPEGGLYFWARLPRNVPTGMKSKVFSDRAEKRRALRAGRNLLCGRPGAAQTEPRNAHQLRQRERGRHPRRHPAAGQGVEEICLMSGRENCEAGDYFLQPISQFASPFSCKAPEGWRSPRRFAYFRNHRVAHRVLECGGPPPLSPGAISNCVNVTGTAIVVRKHLSQLASISHPFFSAICS